MERRDFLIGTLALGGAALAATVAPVEAMPLAPPPAQEPLDLAAAIATQEDMDNAKLENAYWVYRRRYYRPRYYRRRFRRCTYFRRRGYLYRRCYYY